MIPNAGCPRMRGGGPLARRAADLGGADPFLDVIGIAGFALPGTTHSTRARFIALLFDAVTPVGATRLPPPLPEENDFQTALGNVTRT
ncbi:hypothetical protein [Streptomyces sp. NPDC001508]|uniref:hypothetical protein n=1 Tax=Streptomyces sp. NPDC001508 TaxID=3154656 RepID=UPI0033277DE6